MNKFFLIILIVISRNICFSQSGKYILAPVPKEAFDLITNSEGVLECPIYIGSSSITLKSRNKVTIVQSEGDENEKVIKGTWSVEGSLIKVSFDINSKIETLDYSIVKYESGTYLKSENFVHFYRKE